jgi:asparagine synthase (glutamine-hydrolysing)
MCGVTGFLGGAWLDGEDGAAKVLGRMSSAIAHRGPDSGGAWLDPQARIALGHRRLAIVDLSPAGAQPMLSASGRYVVAFNGEVYNHAMLRSELGRHGHAPAWRGHSDTETLLACFEAWGIKAMLERVVGMFAFAVWDRQARELTLGRDRLGEKPLYYGWQGRGDSAVFLFGSELKALRAHPAFAARVNRDALCLYVRYSNVPGTHSIYEGLHKLAPGCLLTVSARDPEPAIQRYWSGKQAVMQGREHPFEGGAEDAVDELEALLTDAVGLQMMSDVPLGAFLSGGVDSSTIVALMQAQSARPIKTFSIGFHEQAYNEAKYAKAVARHLGTDHTELYVTPEQAMDVIPQLPRLYDDPFADSSQIPTFLVSQLARAHVKVALSGDAGDELFGGYNRYRLTANYWRRLSALPLPARRAVAWGLTRFSLDTLNKIGAVIPAGSRWTLLGEKVHKGAAALAAPSAADLYKGVVSQWSDPGSLVLGGEEPPAPVSSDDPEFSDLSDVERMMALDLLTYMPDDILAKVDRAAMGVSLETRTPFLDHRVVEFAWRLPMVYKLRKEGGRHTSKWALRQVAYRRIPAGLIERPKMGFGVPIDSWLRGPLRDWAEELLSEERLRREGYLDPAPIRQKWAEHLSGQHNWQHPLWCVLMFQAWLAEQTTACAAK